MKKERKILMGNQPVAYCLQDSEVPNRDWQIPRKG